MKITNQENEKNIVLYYYLNNLLKHPMNHDLENHICNWFEENSLYLAGINIELIWESRPPRRFWRRGNEEEKDDRQLMPRSRNTIKKLLAKDKYVEVTSTAQRVGAVREPPSPAQAINQLAA